MKHAVIRGPIHAQNCACPRCRHIRGAGARRRRLGAEWGDVALALLLLAAGPPFAAWCDAIRL
jgi:hypothetical protein